MAEAVYLLCAAMSLLCAIALLRTWSRRRTRLLLWSSICFIGLALNNIVLVIDLVITGPQVDLSMLRASLATIALVTLAVGLSWETR